VSTQDSKSGGIDSTQLIANKNNTAEGNLELLCVKLLVFINPGMKLTI
jgi:hypothetical protein